MAMIPAPEYWRNGMAGITAIAMQVHTGGCRLGETCDSPLEMGSVLSRDMPKHSRIVAAMIDRQQTKIAAETTNRYSVGKPVEKLASMTLAGDQTLVIAVCMFGMAISVPSRNTPPMMNAPMMEKRTALGAAR